MDRIYEIEMEQKLEALINAGEITDKFVFAFGHCDATEEMLKYLSMRGITVAAILDNNSAKQGFTCLSARVVMPSYMQKHNSDDSIVLIATRFFEQMSAQLRQIGYDGKIVKIVDYNSFSEYSLSDETFSLKKERVMRGLKTLKRIRNRYPSLYLVICPYNALGDVYWAMAFLPAYLKKHDIKEATVVVTGSGCRQVAEMFGAQNLTVLDRIEMDEFVQALIYTREKNCIIAHHDRPYTDNIIKYLDKRFLFFIDYYKYAVYGLPPDTAPTSPSKLMPFDNREQILKGRTIILAPYAKSIMGIPDIYWESLVHKYRKEGYLGYTSVFGGEQPIKGTKPLSLPLNQMISAVDYAGVFIGIRSGLCDILHTAECRKTIVFPDCIYSTTPYKVSDFFALSGWGKIIV